MAKFHSLIVLFLSRAPALLNLPHGCAFTTISRRPRGGCCTSNALDNISTSSSIGINGTADAIQSSLPKVQTYQKPRQVRRTGTKRKPRNYWQSTKNLRRELFLFWKEHNVPIEEIYPGQPPPIPSEHILNFFQRNDLRGAIASNGGREQISYLMGGAKNIPGKWKDAVELEEVKYLLPLMGSGSDLHEKQPQIAESKSVTSEEHGPYINYTSRDVAISSRNPTLGELKLHDIVQQCSNQTSHGNAAARPANGFWTKETAVLMLYRYLENYKKYKQRPSVWMPQLVELSQEGYSSLFNTCSRFKKLPCATVFTSLPEKDIVNYGIEDMAGLVPYKEWRFFDSQLQLFVELKEYLDLYHNGSEDVFPDPVDVLKNGFSNLHHLIRTHGGKVLLAQKLSMKLYHGESDDETDISWGPFTLDFAIRLLHFIRSEFMTMSPPLAYPMISMPLERDLLRRGQNDLASLVVQFGGYENIARRLGLAYFDEKSGQMHKIAFKGARSLWKQRNAEIDTTINKTSKIMPNNNMKTRGVVWSKDVVVKELHAYVKANMTKRSLAQVWMPRFSQLDKDGRTDLRNAISRFGGQAVICEAAGLIPYSIWTKFESFRELVKELFNFNNELFLTRDNDLQFSIPFPSQMTNANHVCLAELIRAYGGRTAVQDLLVVNSGHQISSLSLLVELTDFIHADMMSREPPFYHSIFMPSEDQLIHDNRHGLVASIKANGGFREVAAIIPGVELSA